ncbi:MAG: 16S rRNA (cytosine(1402)-N(4))-methyltransferase, partial [Acidimicrobiia bacterium]
GVNSAIELVRPQGRVLAISYHSLEDRIVKRRFTQGATGCTCPPELPVCGCGNSAELRILTRKPIRASAAEVEVNNRARSASLRAAEKVAA